MDEFSLIRQFFRRLGAHRDDVLLGVGDDAAVLAGNSPGRDTVVCTDVLVEGVHFPKETVAADVGHKALAVNLSDIAAMGAVPAWATLGLTLPRVDETWLAGFAEGFHDLANSTGVALVGGDTTRGPLAVSVTLLGWVSSGGALRRSGARPGDDVWVSGNLGDAGLGLRLMHGEYVCGDEDARYLRGRLNRPSPRLDLGQKLSVRASACIDISDGLLADLGHILEQSGVGAEIDPQRVPISPAYHRYLESAGASLELALTFGDDYELCFTAAPDHRDALLDLAKLLDLRLSMIGTIEAEPGLRHAGERLVPDAGGYRHFP